MSKKEILIIGFDALTPQLLFRWINKGHLPYFEKFIKEGVYGNLASTLPSHSGPGWASSVTGKNPGKHGIYDFWMHDLINFPRVAGSWNIKGKNIFQILSGYNHRVVSLYHPLTYPVFKVNGILVSGELTPSLDSEFSYPPELKEELLNNTSFKLDIDRTVYRESENMDPLLDEIYSLTESNKEVSLYLMKKYDWDLFSTIFTGPDRIQHFFWKFMDPEHQEHPGENKYRDAILEYYKKLDGVLGEVMDNVGSNTNILIVSDHGMQPIYKTFFVNNWLIKKGYLHLKAKEKKDIYGKKSMKYWMEKLGIKYIKIIDFLKKIKVAEHRKRLPKKLRKFLLNTAIPSGGLNISDADWSKTVAYSYVYDGGIHLNLKDRDPYGVVGDSEYEDLRNNIIEELERLEDPDTGENVVDKLYKKEELYKGAMLKYAPDIYLKLKDGYYSEFRIHPEGRIFGKSIRKNAYHYYYGVFLARGPDIKTGYKITSPEIVDIAPTVLHMLNVPIPMDMDGRVLREIFNPESDCARRGPEYTKDEKEKIKHKIKKLNL